MDNIDRDALQRLYHLRMKKARKLEKLDLFPQKQLAVNQECRALFNVLYHPQVKR
jgi:hypothetical protein